LVSKTCSKFFQMWAAESAVSAWHGYLVSKNMLILFPGSKQSPKRWTPAQILRATEKAPQLAVSLLLALTNGQIVPYLASFCFLGRSSSVITSCCFTAKLKNF